MHEPFTTVVSWMIAGAATGWAIFMIWMCVQAYRELKETQRETYRMFLNWNPRGETYAEWRKRYGFPVSKTPRTAR